LELGESEAIQPKDPAVSRRAAEIAGADRDAWSVARKLSAWTHANLNWKVVPGATPAQTLATREADCLEFSQLYVAMARSVGLPSRIVFGFAHGGDGFIGHAWVEVWAGKWIEIDPTWGTDFVDATHLRTSATGVISYALLDQIEVDILGAEGPVPPERLDAQELFRGICTGLEKGTVEPLEAALDFDAVALKHSGVDRITALDSAAVKAVERSIVSIASAFEGRYKPPASDGTRSVRLMNSIVSGDRATGFVEVTEDFESFYLRLHAQRHGTRWSLVEIENLDFGLQLVRATVRHAVRASVPGAEQGYPIVDRVLASYEKDPDTAISVLDSALAATPGDPELQYLKVVVLYVHQRFSESHALLEKLVAAPNPPPLAYLELGNRLLYGERADQARALAMFETYARLAPDDPRPYIDIASVLEQSDRAGAERAGRRALSLDPASDQAAHVLGGILVGDNRVREAVAVVEGASRLSGSKGSAIESLLDYLLEEDNPEPILELFLKQARDLVEADPGACDSVAHTYLQLDKPLVAVNFARRQVALTPDSARAHSTLASAYIELRRFEDAIGSATRALELDGSLTICHLYRAMGLSQLGRLDEAITDLRVIGREFPYLASYLGDNALLSPLFSRADYKAIVDEARATVKAKESKAEENEVEEAPDKRTP